MPPERHAAIIICSVAPTLGNGSEILFPRSPYGALHSRQPWRSLISAPSFESASRCISIGLSPISHPPGKDNFALPDLASTAPRNIIELRVLHISESGISLRLKPSVLITRV